jgi:serine/threonine protein kinase
MLTIGTLLQNRYEITKPIGQGGMGAVYMARDQRLGNTVALKETFFMDTVLLAAFEREARLLAGLRHVALPKVIDHFADNNGQFLVMEYIPGDDLHDLLQESGGPAPIDEVLQWADQLLDALEYLHSQDPPIVHRDIKPQNLKLTSRNQVVLLDFGLAKGTSLEMSQTNSNSSIFGYTPSYAPLEQVQGSGTDARSDIYSLAATLYHLLTGKKPVDVLTRASSILNGQPDPLVSASEMNPSIPVSLSEVLMQGMVLNKNQRLSSAAKMRGMLRDSARLVSEGKAARSASPFSRTEINQSNSPAALPSASTHLLASSPATAAREPGETGSYTTRASATNMGRPSPARFNERSLNRARPGTAAQRRSATVEISSGGGDSNLAKVVAAGAILMVAVAIIAFVFTRNLKQVDTNAAPISVQKNEPVSGSEPSDSSTKPLVDNPGRSNSSAQPEAPSKPSAREDQPPKTDEETRQAKEPEAGKEVEQEEPRRERGQTPSMKEPEGTAPKPNQPPRRAEEAVRDEPVRQEPARQEPARQEPPRQEPPPYPPPPDQFPPPRYPPPPPGGMPPPRRRP